MEKCFRGKFAAFFFPGKWDERSIQSRENNLRLLSKEEFRKSIIVNFFFPNAINR